MSPRVLFEQDLETLKNKVSEMGEHAEISYDHMLYVIRENKADILKALLDTDHKMVDMQRSIEAMCLSLLTRQQPVARDMRLVSAALKVVTDIERIGDHVADMVELYLRMGNMNSEGKQEKLIMEMMEEAKDMIHNSVEAFVEGDEANAQKVVEHDDVVDESTERRGQLSVNAVFNNKVAVLTGDYLLATALVEVGMTRNYGIIDIVSKLGQDLAEGELLQLSNVSNPEYSEDIYFDVIRKKTAVLFAACMKAGALSVGAGDEKAEYARLFGEYIGLCFQIKDDIFDYYENKEIGKPTGNDMVEGKLTLPALHVLNTVKDKTAEEIAVKIKNGEATPGEIAHLIEFTKQNGGIEYASQVMYDYKEKALSLLASLPDAEVKVALAGYLDYVVEREK